ncbi:MAG: DNA-3-methyladenine glycosylase [Verrucomicrobiota bacterium]
MAKPSKIPVDFYRQDDVVALAPALLGKVLCTKLNGKFTSGIIVETEAYQGTTDKACHAYNNRRTTRTETMFQPGGVAYIYLCYGMYHLFNIVTNIQDVPDAVRVRYIERWYGKELLLKLR